MSHLDTFSDDKISVNGSADSKIHDCICVEFINVVLLAFLVYEYILSVSRKETHDREGPYQYMTDWTYQRHMLYSMAAPWTYRGLYFTTIIAYMWSKNHSMKVTRMKHHIIPHNT